LATTKKLWTWDEISAKVISENDIDLDDDFIDDDELRNFCNDAIDKIEGDVHALYNDYYLKRTPLTLVNLADEIALPTDIYAHKIRKIMYFSGSNAYEVKRIRDWKKFHAYRDARQSPGTREEYRYFLINDTPGAPKILLTPPAYESGQLLECWHLRNLNRLETGTDVCDVIELGMQFIFESLTERIEWKRAAGSPRHVVALSALEKTEAKIAGILAEMVVDDDNTIEPDFSHYEEHN